LEYSPKEICSFSLSWEYIFISDKNFFASLKHVVLNVTYTTYQYNFLCTLLRCVDSTCKFSKTSEWQPLMGQMKFCSSNASSFPEIEP
jgi:hypothetical protein